MIGQEIGRYRVIECLGTGSMGSVYKAQDSETGRLVALKIIRSHILYDPPKRERFLHGLLAVMEIRSRALCPILEIGDQEDDFFVVMPLLEGRTLASRLEQGPLPWAEALQLAAEIGECLAAGHDAGALHRGLKPANIWLNPDGSALVMDFNMARFTELEKDGRTVSSGPKAEFADTIIPMAALASMSPEQVQGRSLDARTDVFSLGCVLYEMLTGHHPFESRSSLSRMHSILEGTPRPLTALKDDLPARIDALVLRALAKRPEERWPSMRSFVDEVRRVRDAGDRNPVPPEPEESGPNAGTGRTFLRWVLPALAFAGLLYYVLSRS
jgi:serine/threonine-protein kinase